MDDAIPAARRPRRTRPAEPARHAEAPAATPVAPPPTEKPAAEKPAAAKPTAEPPVVKLPDPAEVAKAMAGIAERSQRLVQDFVQNQAKSAKPASAGALDPLGLAAPFMELTRRMMADPARLWQAQMAFWRDYAELWQRSARRFMGQEATPMMEPERGDRRFRDPGWSDNSLFDFIKQSYLLSSRWLSQEVRSYAGEMPQGDAMKLDFYTRAFIDAMSPSNFVATNPEVLRATLESGGENLLRGLQNLLRDLERGKGKLAVSMTDEKAFQVGGNIAVTPGKVVFQTRLMQLIQYTPTTETVAKRPILLIPPWINKFYILDLKPENSLIRWMVEQGHTVFVISWVNPDEELAQADFDTYLTEGPLAALDAIAAATGEREINAVGYCLGGTLLASLLSLMAARGDKRVASATFLTTLVDFAEVGELAVFIDDAQVANLERAMETRGYMEADAMSNAFNMLRANDLIWSFVVNNYLLGRDPFPFDLLYWNSDATRMPAAMQSYYLRNMYQANKLAQPGALRFLDQEIDLRRIDVPTYVLATREDHIAPWVGVYRATQLYRGACRFVLAASGHIAGVVNPPASGKYSHWTNDATPADPQDWLKAAEQKPGSWWPDWQRWIGAQSGGSVAARAPGSGGLAALEDAPGSYVKERAAP